MVNIDEVVEKILAKTKEQMIRSFYSLGDIREKGSDWHVLIRHINGDDCENWDFFKFYINGILNLEVEKLTDLQKRMLTVEAYDNLYNYSQAEYLLKATEEERDDELPYYEEQSVENYLFGLLWKFADGDSFMIEEEVEVNTIFDLIKILIEEIDEGLGSTNLEVKEYARRIES